MSIAADSRPCEREIRHEIPPDRTPPLGRRPAGPYARGSRRRGSARFAAICAHSAGTSSASFASRVERSKITSAGTAVASFASIAATPSAVWNSTPTRAAAPATLDTVARSEVMSKTDDKILIPGYQTWFTCLQTTVYCSCVAANSRRNLFQLPDDANSAALTTDKMDESLKGANAIVRSSPVRRGGSRATGRR